MMRKIDRTGGAFSRRSPEKALRRLLGAAVVVLMLCLVFAAPAAAHETDWTILTEDLANAGLTEGKYVLMSDLAITQTLVITSGTVNLCLNGYDIQLVTDSRSSVISVSSGATLILSDCQDKGVISGGTGVQHGALARYDGGGIYVNGGSLVMNGGIISNNGAEGTDGSGVYVNGGTFILNNGRISDNGIAGYDAGLGGGVYLNQESVFTLNGGSISNNTANAGAGVYVNGNSTFVINDGCVSENNASVNGGGGITLADGTVNFYGGDISANHARMGGGVYVSEDTVFNMYGGNISKNLAYWHNAGANGGGVEVFGGNFTIYGGCICDNVAVLGYGGGVASRGSSSIFSQHGGVISNNSARQGGGVYSYNIFNMTGGIISDNTAEDSGGGAFIHHNLGMISGGVITNNTALDNGGGLFVFACNTTIDGGLISNNSAVKGGGVYVDAQTSLFVTNGSIVYNVPDTNGNVYVDYLNGGEFIASGGKFSTEINSDYLAPGYVCYPVGSLYEVKRSDTPIPDLEDTYIVGIDANYPPFTYIDSDGNPAGFDVESIQWIAEQQGFNVIIQPVEWTDIILALNFGQIDMIYSGMSVTPERAEQVTFSDTYWTVESEQYAVAMRNDDTALHAIINNGLAELKASEKWDELIAKYFGGSTSEPTPVEKIIVTTAVELADALNADVSGNVVTLTQDVTLVNPIRIYLNAGEEIILTTAGDYSLYRGVADNSLIAVQRGTLTLKGKDSANQLTIDGRKDIYTENTRSLIDVYLDGCLILSDDAILTNNAAEYGAGVSVGSNGHFEMRGGEISNNYARFGGAGVDVDGEFADYDSEGQVTSVEYGYFNMSGGRICNNDGDGLFNYGITTISGGEISNNTNGISSGGGELIITGGTIHNNTYEGVTLFDGGIGDYVDGYIVYRDTIGKLFISGDMVIPASERVWIDKNSTIIVTSPLSANAGIYNIHTSKESGVIVNATASKISGEDLLSHFVLNEDGYSLTSDGYTLVLSPASTEPTPILNMLLSKTSVNKGDSLRVYGETTLPAGTNLTLRLVAGNIQDEDTEVVDAFFLYVQEGDAEMNTWSTQYDTSALEAGEYFFIIFSTDNPDVVFNTASFAVTESTTPTPEKPAAPTLTPPESLPEDATVTTNTVAETNAATKAEVGYQVNPADVTTMKAPTITRGKLSVQLNEGVKVVKTLSDGKTVEVEATVNEDGSINLPSGALDDAAAVTVNFIGRQFGDVTNDGKPDTLDAARVLQASVGLFDFSGADTFYGDVSGDGFANTLDAARILQYSVSLVDENYVMKE